MDEGGGDRNGMEGIVVGMLGNEGRGGKVAFGRLGPVGRLGSRGNVVGIVGCGRFGKLVLGRDGMVGIGKLGIFGGVVCKR